MHVTYIFLRYCNARGGVVITMMLQLCPHRVNQQGTPGQKRPLTGIMWVMLSNILGCIHPGVCVQ